eukprot:10631541-Karenia_brevis.AAC.1
MIEVVLEALVCSWAQRHFGFAVDDDQPRITHVIWADNIFIIGSDPDPFQIMISELTERIYEHKLRWKSSSLEYIVAGPREMENYDIFLKPKNQPTLQMKKVTELKVLGDSLNSRGA